MHRVSLQKRLAQPDPRACIGGMRQRFDFQGGNEAVKGLKESLDSTSRQQSHDGF